MHHLRTGLLVVLLAAGALAACGDAADERERQPARELSRDAPEDPPSSAADAPPDSAPSNAPAPASAAPNPADARRPAGEDGLRVAPAAARLTSRNSEFGRVLFDANGQVVYAFDQDRPNRSNCVSEECVTAWPPMLTKRAPTAGPGVDAKLLGTTRRADGSLQVTYAGRPLYFYEHEAPGEIKCHDVDIHGGVWRVVDRRGRPVGT